MKSCLGQAWEIWSELLHPINAANPVSISSFWKPSKAAFGRICLLQRGKRTLLNLTSDKEKIWVGIVLGQRAFELLMASFGCRTCFVPSDFGVRISRGIAVDLAVSTCDRWKRCLGHQPSRRFQLMHLGMMPDNSNATGVSWLIFSLLTVASWGVYGIFLHNGQVAMGDPVNGRYKAFLFVGVAYFLTAVLAPLALLLAKGASWSYPVRGMGWSLVAGVVGAIGAFGVLLAFGAKGTPAVVMSIVFAGAPVVNALYSLWLHPPAGGLGAIRPQFVLGILLAALGGCLVTFYKPNPGAVRPAQHSAQSHVRTMMPVSDAALPKPH